MQILRLLAARRAASTNLQPPASTRRDCDDDEGPFFDLDFSSCSVRASSSGSSVSDSDSDDSCAELDFIISLHRSRSASPLYFPGASAPPPERASSLQHRARRRGSIGTPRTLSFGVRQAAPLYGGGRPSFARSSTSGRRSSSSSAQSLRLFLDSPHDAAQVTEHGEHRAAEKTSCRRAAPSRDVIRRCLAKISRRLRTATAASPRATEARGGLRRLRKCRSASSAAPRPSSATARREDGSAVEKQDGIAGAIAHCKESLHRASTSDCGSPLLRSRSDPGKCEAEAEA